MKWLFMNKSYIERILNFRTNGMVSLCNYISRKHRSEKRIIYPCKSKSHVARDVKFAARGRIYLRLVRRNFALFVQQIGSEALGTSGITRFIYRDQP